MESLVDLVPRHQVKLRFFDVDAVIRSDSRTCIQLFTQTYQRLRVEAPSAPRQAPVEFTVLTRPEEPWGRPVMILDREVVPLHSLSLLQGHVYERILHAIMARVRSHFLIHAGVVAHQGQGIILAGDSLYGKTTLALELVRRGFTLLSDELAPLGRLDRQVHPFPRSLRIRPGTLELTGFAEAADNATSWSGKLLLDIEKIKPGSLGQISPINHVIILRDPVDATKSSANPDQEFGVRVDRADKALLSAIRNLNGVRKVQVNREYNYPVIQVSATHKTRVLSQIEVLCQERRVEVLQIIKRPLHRPDFTRPVRLEPLTPSQGVMELLQRFPGGHRGALLQDDFRGSSARLFLELAATVGQARYHSLAVGPLHQMADLVERLVDGT
jgi:hypothetical protein